MRAPQDALAQKRLCTAPGCSPNSLFPLALSKLPDNVKKQRRTQPPHGGQERPDCREGQEAAQGQRPPPGRGERPAPTLPDPPVSGHRSRDEPR